MIQSIMLIVVSTLLLIITLRYKDVKEDLEFAERYKEKYFNEKWEEHYKCMDMETKLIERKMELSKERAKTNEAKQIIKAILCGMEDKQIKIEEKTLNKEINGDICVEDDILTYSKIIKLIPKWVVMK